MKEVSCNYCKKNDIKVLYLETAKNSEGMGCEYACTNDGHGEYFRIVKCRNCGLIFSSPRPDSFVLENEYRKVEDNSYQEEYKGRVRTFQRNLKKLSKYKAGGELLDIGCSIGIFLDEARSLGWKVLGIEPSEWCVNQCKMHYGINILQGTYKKLGDLNKKFDVVTMWDVLEHVDDPMAALKNSKEVLKDGGVLVFSTVDIGSLYAKVLGKKWPWLMKMHIYYFDRRIIKKYLKSVGFELLEIDTYKHIVSVKYLLQKLLKVNKFLYVCLYFIERMFIGGKDFFIPVAMGDFMVVYAKKENSD